MTRPSLLTLFLAAAVANLFVATPPAVNALQGMNLSPPLVRRVEHINMNKRMVKKKRQDNADELTPGNAAPDPDPVTTTTAADTAADTASATATASQTQTPSNGNGNGNGNGNSSADESTSSSTTRGSLLDDLESLFDPTSTSTTSSTPSSSLESSSSTSISSAAPTEVSETSETSSSTSIRSLRQSTATITATASDTSATQTDQSKDPDATFLPKPVIIGLIVAGSCVVASAAIWTVIRKWKFSPSRHFEDRLEPVTWEPTNGSGVNHDPTIAALGRASSKNSGRPDSIVSSGDPGARNMTNANSQPLTMGPDFPPAHDFTAGAAVGPAYNQGYADMYRGPSPAPGQYGASGYGGQYETPNPYDSYNYNPGYGQRHY